MHWWARPSPVGLLPIVGGFVAGLVGVYITFFLGVGAPGFIAERALRGPLLAGSGALLFAIIGLGFELVRRTIRLFFSAYVVTGERVYAVSSFLSSTATSIPLARVTRVTLRRGPVTGVLGLWTAQIDSYRVNAANSRRRSGPQTVGGMVLVPHVRDGAGLLREVGDGTRRGANVAWLRRGD